MRFDSEANLLQFLGKLSNLQPSIKRLAFDSTEVRSAIEVAIIRRPTLLFVRTANCKSLESILSAPANMVHRWERNQTVALLTTPPDGDFNQQCGLHTIRAESAWDIVDRDDAEDIKVAVVDSGVFGHDDLLLTSTEKDYYGHGTHLAGVIGATQNGKGTVGVVWNLKLYGYRFTDPFGQGTLIDAIASLEQALQDSPNIVVLAWGVATYSEDLYQLIKEKGDVLFVAAAGNSHEDLNAKAVFPAAFAGDASIGSHLISVMATTCTDDLPTQFSSFSSKKDLVDLAAPGAAMLTAAECVDACHTCPHGILSTVVNNRYCCLKGTSMSAAFVAGAAALVWPRIAGATAQKVKTCLMESVWPVAALKGMCRSEGRLDLRKAVDPAIRPTSCYQ